MGENPSELIEAYEGELKYIKYIPIDEKGGGKMDINEEEIDIIGCSAAAAAHFGVTISTFASRIEKANIKPIVPVDANGMAKVKIGERQEDTEVVAACAGAWAHYKTTQSTFNNQVRKAGLNAVIAIQARLPNGNLEAFYLKSEVDKIIVHENVADENGLAFVQIGDEQVEVVGSCEAANEYYQVACNTFMAGLRDAGILPIEGIKIRSKKGGIPVYRKSEVDKIFPRVTLIQVDENGFGKTVIGEEEVEVVALCEGACAFYSISKFTQTMERKGIKIIESHKAKIGKKKMDLYRKSEVDAACGGKLIEIDEFGMAEIEIDGSNVLVAATTKSLLEQYGKNAGQLQYFRNNSGIKPIPGVRARDGNRKLDVYRFDDLKAFLFSE